MTTTQSTEEFTTAEDLTAELARLDSLAADFTARGWSKAAELARTRRVMLAQPAMPLEYISNRGL